MSKYLICILWLFSVASQAEMVDSFEFNNAQDRVRAVELAKSLRCPQCQNQNLVESNSPIAYDLRLEVYNMVNQGKSNEQIVQAMTDRFGNFVRYNPPFVWTTAFLWIAPFALLLLACALMLRYVRQRAKLQAKSTALSPAQQQALADLLEKKL